MAFKLKKEDLIIKDYQNIQVDKGLDHIVYNDGRHVYFNKNTGERYTSVTTLIHMYANEFDNEKWSRYKAIERIITAKAQTEEDKKAYFSQYKKQAGGYNNVVSYFETTTINGDEVKLAKLQKIQEKIKEEWKETNKQSLIKGSAFHKKKEDYYMERCEAYYNSILYKIVKNNDIRDGGDYAIYPELLIYNDEYKIAGQADLIIRTKNDLTVRDYKTNKELKMTNPFQKMFYPISSIDDCNYNHYQLQLSLYAFMLSANYGLNVKDLIIDHHPDEGQDYVYPCTYLFEQIEAILEDYKMKYTKLLNS